MEQLGEKLLQLRHCGQSTYLPQEHSYIKGFEYFGGLNNAVYLIDVLNYNWGTKAKGKIVDRKGNICCS